MPKLAMPPPPNCGENETPLSLNVVLEITSVPLLPRPPPPRNPLLLTKVLSVMVRVSPLDSPPLDDAKRKVADEGGVGNGHGAVVAEATTGSIRKVVIKSHARDGHQATIVVETGPAPLQCDVIAEDAVVEGERPLVQNATSRTEWPHSPSAYSGGASPCRC